MADTGQIAINESSIQVAYYILTLFGGLGAGVAAYARSLHNKIDNVSADLAEFKTHVAGEYLSADRFDNMTKQITESIRELGNRIDRLFHRDHNAS
jgi:hypothetical protein